MSDTNSLFFLRHGKLNLPYADHSLIPLEVLADLASGRQNPPIDEDFNLELLQKLSGKIPFSRVTTLYSSPAKRCQNSAGLIAKFIESHFGRVVEVKVLPELKEIDFDLLKIYHSKPGGRIDINLLNQAVLESIIKGKNTEPLEQIEKRVGYLFLELLKEKSAIKIVISHDFLMRFIELYLRNTGQFPPNLATKDLNETQRNLYLSGFCTDYSLSSFDKI